MKHGAATKDTERKEMAHRQGERWAFLGRWAGKCLLNTELGACAVQNVHEGFIRLPEMLIPLCHPLNLRPAEAAVII